MDASCVVAAQRVLRAAGRQPRRARVGTPLRADRGLADLDRLRCRRAFRCGTHCAAQLV